MLKVSNSKLEAIFELLTPDYYSNNPFRLLELDIDAKGSEIAKRRKLIEISLSNNDPIPPGPGRAFPISNNKLDNYTIADAIQRLNDPIKRFVDEFFWFWPLEAKNIKSDEALIALRKDDIETALTIWIESIRETGDAIALHNLAVFAHLQALDLELFLNSDLKNEDTRSSVIEKANYFWKQSYRRFLHLLNIETFWNQFEQRVIAIDDPRLNSNLVKEFRSLLPELLLAINARLALNAAEKRKNAELARHFEVMALINSHERIRDILTYVLEPYRQRIKSYLRRAKEEIEGNPTNADRIIENLFIGCNSDLETLSLITEYETVPLISFILDEFSSQCADKIREFARKTDKWKKCTVLFETLLKFRMSDHLRAEIEENLNFTKEMACQGHYWHAEDYFDLPNDIYEEIETAYQKAIANEWNECIEILEKLYQKVEPKYEKTILKALAFSYCEQATRTIQNSLASISQPTKVKRRVLKILAQEPDALLSKSLFLLRFQPGMPIPDFLRNCSMCGASYSRGWYIYDLNIDNEEKNFVIRVLLCERCKQQEEAEELEKHHIFSNALGMAYKFSSYAHAYDPDNLTAVKIKQEITQWAKEAKIQLPHVNVDFPKKSNKNTRIENQDKQNRTTDTQLPASTSSKKVFAPSSLQVHFSSFAVDSLMVVFVYLILHNWLHIGYLSFSAFLYYSMCYLVSRKTIGEWITDSRVVKINKKPANVVTLVLRGALYCIPIAFHEFFLFTLFQLELVNPLWFGLETYFSWLPLGLYLLPIFTKRHRGFQDFLSGTVLVMRRQ